MFINLNTGFYELPESNEIILKNVDGTKVWNQH